MAIRQETGVRRFIGLSTDVKPYVGAQADGTLGGTTLTGSDLPPGSTLLESDTGRIYRWDGSAWTFPFVQNSVALLEAIDGLRVEIAALRLGMIDAGNCKEVNLEDVQRG